MEAEAAGPLERREDTMAGRRPLPDSTSGETGKESLLGRRSDAACQLVHDESRI